MKKKKISFPSALTVLFIVLIFAAILTAVVPAGLYSKLTYNADYDVFEITTPEGEVTEMAPTQESLDELGVTGNLNKFLDGSISKPIAVPGTYETPFIPRLAASAMHKGRPCLPDPLRAKTPWKTPCRRSGSRKSAFPLMKEARAQPEGRSINRPRLRAFFPLRGPDNV